MAKIRLVKLLLDDYSRNHEAKIFGLTLALIGTVMLTAKNRTACR